jgi:dihydrofolate reductase
VVSELAYRQPGREEGTVGKLVVTEFVTLDGVAQAPGGPDEDESGGFTHGGWQAPLMDKEGGDNVFEQAKSMDALLLGRRTYEIFANFWPTAPPESPFTGLLNGVPKYVASRTLAGPLDWQGTTVVGDSLAEGVTSVKERHDEVHVIGSLNLVQSLLRFGLVDRLELWLYPVLLGSGKQVFDDGTVPTALLLVESVTHPTGVVQLTYDAVGTPTYGRIGSAELTSE